MNWAATSIVLIAVAIWVAAPDPRDELRRLDRQPFSGRGWLARLARGRDGTPHLRTRVLMGLLAAGVPILALPGSTGLLAGIAVLGAVVLGGSLLGVGKPGAGAVQTELADTVELLAVCLSAGAPMQRALEVVTEVSGTATAPVLARVSGQLRVGVPEQQAWCELADDDEWGPVARDVARSARSGTSLVEVLHVHADEARLVAQEQALKRARTAGVRSVVPLMVCFLPAFVLVGVVPIIAGLLEGLLST
ncbi:type II secretion system F family protein [Tessaracoccus sp.]